jgi:uncharacterized protein (TIGR02588 family)
MMSKTAKAKVAKNRLEWFVFGLGLALVLATIGYLAREALTTGDGPPEVVVRFGDPRPGADGYMVPVTVYNRGDRTAEEVIVRIELSADDVRETADLAVAFLPRRSRREGWVAFRTDPRLGELRVGAVAYEVP